MRARLTEIDLDEALRYLGVRGGAVSQETREALGRCARAVREAASPAAVWRLFDIGPDGALAGADFCPEGADVRALLSGCGQAVLLAATLGAGIDALLRRAQATDMAGAVMIDACASAAIENVTDCLCADIEARLSPLRLTRRFSPGYGDMPLGQQAALCVALDAGRQIGLSLTPGGMMLPQKSVTAIAGVTAAPDRTRADGPHADGCARCARFADCAYRKDGIRCEDA